MLGERDRLRVAEVGPGRGAMALDADTMPRRRPATSVPQSMAARRMQSESKPPLAHADPAPKRPATVGAVMRRSRQQHNDLQVSKLAVYILPE